MCVCSLRYPACSAHAPYCHLWPAPIYNIFLHYLISGHDKWVPANTVCPTRYRTRHSFNNFTTNEDIATIRRTTDTFLFISHTTNVLLFKFRCSIFIGVRIIKEMPGSVANGTPCILNKQSRKADKEWSSSFGFGRGANRSTPSKLA